MSTLTLQPDPTAGIDTFTKENLPTTSNATSATLNTNGAAANRGILLFKFDVSSIPAGSTVSSAVLTLWNQSTATASKTHSVYSILSANSGWIETSTWDYKVPSTVRWAGDTGADAGTDAGCSVSGTDYNSTAIGSFTYGANDVADTQYDITLTNAAIEAWINGANYGLAVVRTGATTTNLSFRSSDYVTDTTKRPKLVITYTAPSSDDSMAQTIQIGSRHGVQQMRTGGARMMNIG